MPINSGLKQVKQYYHGLSKVLSDAGVWNSMPIKNDYFGGTVLYTNVATSNEIYFYFVGENNARMSNNDNLKPSPGTIMVDFSKQVDRLTKVSGKLKWVIASNGVGDNVGEAGLAFSGSFVTIGNSSSAGPSGLLYTSGGGYSVNKTPGLDAGSFCVATYNKWIG